MKVVKPMKNISDNPIIDILSQLVSYQTFSPDILNSKQYTDDYKIPDNYQKCKKYIESFLLKHNFKTESYEFEGFPMLLGWLRNSITPTSPRILILMHFDVVPVNKNWENAFTMITKEESNLGLTAEGRGVADMKGSIAALLISLEQLSKVQNGDICLAFTSDEEIGGARGAGRWR